VIYIIESLSNKLTAVIKKYNADIDEEKEEIINYGLNLAIYEIILVPLIFISAFIFGIFKYVLVFFTAYGILRFFTGGAHANSRIKCSLIYFAYLYGSVFLAKYIWPDNLILFAAVLLINILVIWFYAPGDTIEKPILSSKMKKRQKILSFCTLAIIFILAFIFRYYDITVHNILVLSTIPVVFSLSPLGYKVMKCKHSYEQ